MNCSANKFHFILNSVISSGDQLNWPLRGKTKTRVSLSFDCKIKMWMVKNLLAIKTYPVGIHRYCMHNEYSYQEHPHLLKELNILLNFNRCSCGKWKKCFSTWGFLKILSKGSCSFTPSGVGSKAVCLAHLHVLTKCHNCPSKVAASLP